jgi:hypothetical protein
MCAHHHVLQRGHAVEHPRRLEHHADAERGPAVGGEPVDAHSVECDRSVVRAELTTDQVEQG